MLPRNDTGNFRIFYDEIPRSSRGMTQGSRGMTQGLRILEFLTICHPRA
ncbi:hypothetical protein [Campylobacter sp.]|nr:hypothetical protein [Campylobacter sp.]